MRTREVIIGDRILLASEYEAPEQRRKDDDEDPPRGRVQIAELVPDAYQM